MPPDVSTRCTAGIEEMTFSAALKSFAMSMALQGAGYAGTRAAFGRAVLFLN
jgi:hypothetical protein